MNHRIVVSCALATALASLGAAAHEAGEVKGQERCFGVVKAGENDCANLAGTHDCAGQAATDRDPGDWKYVPRGSCRKLKGLTEAQARARLGLAAKR